jgi:hypothetical protein
MKKKPAITVVSFATDDTFYRACLHRLRLSVVVHDLEYRFEIRRPVGDWKANCAMKARFCLEKLNAIKGPILWLDADAEIIKMSWRGANALLVGNPDFAAYIPELLSPTMRFPQVNSRLLSGTIYFNNTARAKALCEEWVRQCNQHPDRLDQESLFEAMCIVRPEFHNLNPVYVCIPDLMPDVRPFIVHHQASRHKDTQNKPTVVSHSGIEIPFIDAPPNAGEFGSDFVAKV